MTSPLPIPYLSYEDRKKRADSFLQTYHPKRTIPIPTEEVIEFKFKKDKKDKGVKSFVDIFFQ